MTDSTQRLRQREAALLAEIDRRRSPSERQADAIRGKTFEVDEEPIGSPSQRQAARLTRKLPEHYIDEEPEA